MSTERLVPMRTLGSQRTEQTRRFRVARSPQDSVPAPTYALGINLAASIVTAAATVALALVAVCQIRAGREQTRKTLEIGEAQAASALVIARQTREAAERQWQPRVFARYHGHPAVGDGFTAAPDEIAVPYYLVNEGTGPAFNVEVGIEVAGRVYPRYGVWWSMQAREFIPPLEVNAKQPVPSKKLYIGVKESTWKPDSYAYVTRFENLLGERFEVRSYPDSSGPSEFRHVAGSLAIQPPEQP